MRIFKDSVIYLMGELAAKSLPFLMLPYLTRKLGTAGFGELSFYLTMLSLFGIIIGLSQEGAVTRYFYFYGKHGLSNIIKAGYLYNFIVSLLFLLGCWLFQSEILAYIVIATTFQSYLNVMLATQQCQKKPWPYIAIQLLLSLSNVIYTVLALEWFSAEDQVRNRILAIVLANATTFFIVVAFNHKSIQLSKKISWLRLKKSSLYIFSFGLPLILHQSSFFIKGQLDRIFIYKNFSMSELGIYSAGVQIASVLPIIFMALNKACVPHYYEMIKNSKITNSDIVKYAIYALPFSILPSIIVYLLPNNLYTAVLGEGFKDSQYYTSIFTLGFGLNLPYLILVNYLFFYGKNFLISKLTIYSSLIYLATLFILAKYSLHLVPFSLIISNIFLILVLFKTVKNFNEV